jgi:hypothetical protein
MGMGAFNPIGNRVDIPDWETHLKVVQKGI